MSFWSAVVLIVLICVVGGVIANRQKRMPDPGEGDEKAELRREIRELKQRIQVLERIATDKSRQLAEQIDDLDKLGKD
jgi:Na+-transporting methylmalonyl-CoA/oxaloacetate decarboxylase gamma subunit|tara:strand:- start:90584 stop:90817 length:234 start_codon:yes stop_codon:yes gene_type:complete